MQSQLVMLPRTSGITPHDYQLIPPRSIARRTSGTAHDPPWPQSYGRIAYCSRAPLPIDSINCRHELLGALPIVLVKEMGLDLMRRYQRSQDDASFLIAIAFTKELLDASKRIPDQFRRILGGDREGDGHTIGVLRLIGKPICHQKDSEQHQPPHRARRNFSAARVIYVATPHTSR